MSIYKRGQTWWVRFTTPSGQRIRRSTGATDRQAAQEFHDKLKAEIWRQQKLGERPRRTWNEAAIKWLTERAHKASLEKDKEILRWLDPYLSGRYLDEITRELVSEIASAKAKETSPQTANRHLALIRSILRRARDEWEWVDRIPKVSMYASPKRRIRWITREQADNAALLPPAAPTANGALCAGYGA